MTEHEQPEHGGQHEGDKTPVRAQHVSARVPDRVGDGVFSSGLILMTGGTEFVADFVQNVGPPAKIVARVVMPHAVLPQLIEALRKNLELYTQKFGAPPELPRAEPKKRPTIQEVYDDLKLPDEQLSGMYANGLMISHGASEFKLDFLSNLFPQSAVSSRVYLSAPQVPRIIESLSNTWQQFQQRTRPPSQDSGSEIDTTDDNNPPPDEPAGGN
jgi:hypothetical protein